MASTQRVEDFNGWFEVARNPISKVGVFPYLGSSLGPDMIKEQNLDPEKVYMVFRSAEELAKPEFLLSCTLIPWINDHTMLGSDDKGYTRPEEKGIGGVTGEQVLFDENDETVYSNIKLFSEAHKNEVANGKRELSLGYQCAYEWKPGEYNGEKYDLIQRNLRGNHLASVDDGRMGPSVAVLDHNDIKGASAMDEIQKLLAALAEAIAKLVPSTDPEKVVVEDEEPEVKATDEDVKATDEEPEVKATDEDVKATDEEPEVKATDEDDTKPVTVEAMDAAVNSRVLAQFKALQAGDALAKKLKPHVGVFDHSGKTEAQIAAYGVKKLGLNVDKGTEVSSLKGWLIAKGDPSKDVTVRNGMVDAMDAADGKPTLMQLKQAERSKA
jgi:Uncharacterized protein conserved in bacteria